MSGKPMIETPSKTEKTEFSYGKQHLLQRINYDMLYLIFIRIVIILVTATTLMKLERAL